jgi:hypothetical protein
MKDATTGAYSRTPVVSVNSSRTMFTAGTAIDRLFERIGIQVSAGVMKTRAALEAERVVSRDLSASR